MLLGIDVSKHQGAVDFAGLRASSDPTIAFCYVKSSEGVGYQDPRFAQNWRNLLDVGPPRDPAGIMRGAYHFGRPDLRPGRSGGETEGKYFVSVLQTAGGLGEGCLPPMLDAEKWSKSDEQDNVPWIEGFCAVVDGELGRRCGIYTGRAWWRYEAGDSDAFVDRPLWLASYSRAGFFDLGVPAKPLRTDWPHTFWQWSGGGAFDFYGELAKRPIPTFKGAVDVNRFEGDRDALLELAQVQFSPDSEPRIKIVQGAILELTLAHGSIARLLEPANHAVGDVEQARQQVRQVDALLGDLAEDIARS